MTDGLKIHATARNVSGIIESRPSTVANTDPKRMPRYAGMKRSRIPMIEIPSVHHAIGVWMGVNPDCERLSLLTRYPDARIMLIGPTGNQPSQYAQAVKPFTCSAALGQRVLNAGYA